MTGLLKFIIIQDMIITPDTTAGRPTYPINGDRMVDFGKLIGPFI
jgi:hypothetical protein